MALSPKEVEALLKTISLTKTDELTCEECLRDLAQFAERALQGKSISESLQAIEHHLTICAECQEEYQALLTALSQAK